MPFKKIGELPDIDECRFPEHNQPSLIKFYHGIFEWKCPKCGNSQTIISRDN